MTLCENSNPSWQSLLLQYGLGAFETMRARQGRIALWPWHRRRLSQALLHWELEKDEDWWQEKEKELLSKIPKTGLWRVKLLLGLDSSDTLLSHITISPFIPTSFQPLELDFVELQMNPAPMNYKSTAYAQHYLAHRRAQKKGLHDAIYGNPERKLLECATAAIFLINKKGFKIPKLASLDSVCQRALMEKAPNEGGKKDFFIPSCLFPDQLLAIGNALWGLRPVSGIWEGDSRIKLAMPSELLKKLEHYNELLFS